MTDRFEDSIRDAVRGLPSTSGDMPTYHDAWHRGRRRRLVKRSALAAAGALVLVAALSVNLGRFPGTDPTDVADVATGAERATAVFEPTPLATTAPVETPAVVPPASTAPAAIPLPTAAEPTAAEPTTSPDAAAASATDSVVTAVPQESTPPVPTQPAAATTAPTEPTVVPVPTPTAPTATDADPALTSDGQSTAQQTAPTTDAEQTPDPGAAGTAQQPADPGSPDHPPGEPELAFTTAAAADATLLGGAARGVALPCDIDQDGRADAMCELLVFEYGCTGDGDVRAGYDALDLNGDGQVDTCIVMDITMCDTDRDGRGDTPCIIELTPPPTDVESPDQESG